ncbi:MAG: MFS transporter [Oscillospiraceae bacterium]|nr:MFS transporter [Oscillospiraceae bacterium]
MTRLKQSKYYVLIVVAVCFLVEFLALGFCSGTKKLFLGPITEALGFERSLFGFNDTCRYVFTALLALFFGPLISRFGTKKLLAAGFLSLILSTTCYAVANNIYVFYIGGCLLGIGMGLTTSTMITSIIRAWCKGPHTGKILGLVLGANGIGGATATMILSPIIASSTFGYRTAYLVIIPLLVIVGMLAVIFLDDPAEGGVKVQKKKGRGNNWVGLDYSVARRKAFFYAALFGVFLTGMMLQGASGIDKAHMSDVGISEAYITGIISMGALILTCAKFLTGACYDKFCLRVTLLLCDMIAVVAMVTLAAAGPSPSGMTYALIHCVCSPLSLPLETVMLSLITNDMFGDASFNKVLGIVTAVNYAGFAVCSPLVNLCYDVFGTYVPVLYAFAVMMLVVAVVFQFAITSAHKTRRAVEAQICA